MVSSLQTYIPWSEITMSGYPYCFINLNSAMPFLHLILSWADELKPPSKIINDGEDVFVPSISTRVPIRSIQIRLQNLLGMYTVCCLGSSFLQMDRLGPLELGTGYDVLHSVRTHSRAVVPFVNFSLVCADLDVYPWIVTGGCHLALHELLLWSPAVCHCLSLLQWHNQLAKKPNMYWYCALILGVHKFYFIYY